MVKMHKEKAKSGKNTKHTAWRWGGLVRGKKIIKNFLKKVLT